MNTCNTVGNVWPLSVERANKTLNISVPSPLRAPVGCSHAIFTLPLGSTATCGKAGATEPEGAMLIAGHSGSLPGAQLVKVLPPSSERLKNMPWEFGPPVGPPDQAT